MPGLTDLYFGLSPLQSIIPMGFGLTVVGPAAVACKSTVGVIAITSVMTAAPINQRVPVLRIVRLTAGKRGPGLGRQRLRAPQGGPPSVHRLSDMPRAEGCQDSSTGLRRCSSRGGRTSGG